MSDNLKLQIQNDMKDAMRAKDQTRLGTIRLLMAAIKQVEIDDQKVLADADVLTVINKMIKQRRDSIAQFSAAHRQELADKEQAEITILQGYLPEQLSEAEITALIAEAIKTSGATEMRDMGKVMGLLKTKLAGRADMSEVSKLIKEQLQ